MIAANYIFGLAMGGTDRDKSKRRCGILAVFFYRGCSGI